MELVDPVPVVAEDDGIGTTLVVCPDLFGQQAPLLSAVLQAFHPQQHTAPLVHVVHGQDADRFGMLELVWVAPGGGEGEPHGVREIDFKAGQFLSLVAAIHGDCFDTLGLLWDSILPSVL